MLRKLSASGWQFYENDEINSPITVAILMQMIADASQLT
jgi:hypothetical protein